jgi:hypothetical protein
MTKLIRGLFFGNREFILATLPSQGVGPGPRNRALTEEQCISITAVNKVRNLRIELAPKTCGSKETPDPMEGSHYGG